MYAHSLKQLVKAYDLKLFRCDPREQHLRIRGDAGEILADLWPTQRRLAVMWPSPSEPGSFINDKHFTFALRDVLRHYAWDRKAAQLREKAKARTDKAKRKPRVAAVELSLEGRALRIALSSPQFSDSWRLTLEDTEQLMERLCELFHEYFQSATAAVQPTEGSANDERHGAAAGEANQAGD